MKLPALMVAAALVAISASAVAAPEPAKTSFRVGGVGFSLPLPAGFCLPSGKAADVAQLTAAADTNNVTDATIVDCGKSSGGDYYLIKTPRAMLTAQIDRAELLSSLGAEFERPELKGSLETGTHDDKASKSTSEAFGRKISIDGKVVPVGRDDICGYMAGVLSLSSDAKTAKSAVSVCVTSIGKRVIFVYLYSSVGDTTTALKNLAKVRQLAQKIQVAPAS